MSVSTSVDYYSTTLLLLLLLLLYQEGPDDGEVVRGLTPPDGLSAQAEDDLCGPQHGDHGGGLGDGHGQGNGPEGHEHHDGRHQEEGNGVEREGEGVGHKPVGEKEAREEGEEDREHAGHQHQVDSADHLVGLHHAHVDDVGHGNGRGHVKRKANTQPVVSALLHLLRSLVGPAGQVGGQVGGEVGEVGGGWLVGWPWREDEGWLHHQDVTQHCGNLLESLNLLSFPTNKKTEQH